MTAKIWKMLLAAPVAGAALFMSTAPMATAQVTSISQLSDVQPTDWAFQALQSLVERYGCIAGYPDGTFRGNRAMTRYEFAAGMNACLDRINELIAAGLADKVSIEDLATVQRLQEEFAAELAALRGRVDALEAATAELQAQQFSTTTKLRGEVITGLFSASDNNATVPYRVRLNFDASFFGTDRLRVRLQARNAPGFTSTANGLNGVISTGVSDPVGLGFSGGGGGNVVLDDLYYTFRAFDESVLFFAGLNSTVAGDFFTYGSPLGGLSDFDGVPDLTQDIGLGMTPGFLSAGLPNISAGANAPFGFNGATNTASAFGFNWQIADWVSFAYGFTSFSATDPDLGTGVFNGPYANSVELAFTPTETLLISLQYTNLQDGDLGDALALGASAAANNTNSISSSEDAFAVAVNWEITPRVIFTGFYATADRNTTSVGTAINSGLNSGLPFTIAGANNGTTTVSDWLIGFVFPDLFREGATGGISVGQPGSLAGNQATIYEAYYTFPVSRNISITPGIYHISNVVGSTGVTVGGVRTTFSF